MTHTSGICGYTKGVQGCCDLERGGLNGYEVGKWGCNAGILAGNFEGHFLEQLMVNELRYA